MITTTAAPNRPRPTVNMPATPPVRNAIRMAGPSPPAPSRAAGSTHPPARGANGARAYSQLPRHPAGAEGDPHGGPPSRRTLARGGSHPHVAAHGQRHPGEPGQGRESSSHQEKYAAAPPHPLRVRGQQQEDEEDRDDRS